MNPSKKSGRGWYIYPGVGIFVLGVYLFTRMPAVGLIDSGELAAGCYHLNILHPTGYPLYTLLGRLATLIPLGSVVNRLAFLSALFSAAGVVLFILFGEKIGCDPSVAAAGGVLLGLSRPVWSISTDVEVYSLTLFLLTILWLAVARPNPGRLGSICGYFAGLVLTNHLSGLPAVFGAGVALLFRMRRLRRFFFGFFPFFLLGISPYIYLFLRARAGPLFSWGDPVNLERFWWHITGRQYRVWMFSSSFKEVLQNALQGTALISRAFGYILVPFVIFGLIRLWRENRGLAAGLALSALGSFFYAVNYSIPDIQAYFIPVLLPCAIFAVFGVSGIRPGWLRHLIWVLPLGTLFFNFPHENRRDDWVACDQAVNTLNSADSNSIVVTDWWDIYAPVFYLQQVEGVRKDVCVIDKELLRRSWYFKYLEKQYPWLIAHSKAEVDSFLAELFRFEHNLPYQPQKIQKSYINLLRSFFNNNPERRFYTTFSAEANDDARQMLEGFNLVPVGILFEVRVDTVVPEFDFNRLRVRIPARILEPRTRVNLERYRLFVERRLAVLSGRRAKGASGTSAPGQNDEAQALFNWYRDNFIVRRR